MSAKERRYLTRSRTQSVKARIINRRINIATCTFQALSRVSTSEWKATIEIINRGKIIKLATKTLFSQFLSSAGDTLESSSSLAFLSSIHQPRRSLPRSRPPDSSGCVSIEREYMAVRRIRCAYVCTRSRMCSIKRLRDRGSSLEECWSQRIISLV